jgi:hypothetical protein
MKLVEVVILTGMQCISPIQNTSQATVAAKVWCAVVVEKDTVANAVVVTPQAQANHPAVQVVLQRLNPAAPAQIQSAPLTTQPTDVLSERRPPMPVPAAGPPDDRVQQQAQPEAIAPKPIPSPEIAADKPTDMPSPESETEPETETGATASLDPAPAAEPKAKPDNSKPAAAPQPSVKKRSSQCTGSAKPVWYTNKDGRRKYRCRRSAGGNLY